MSKDKKYSAYAVLCELSSRDLKRKLDLFPEEFRYYAILANAIIGAENAKRSEEVPPAIAEDGKDFVSQMMAIADPDKDETFKGILATCFIETMKDELRNCCSNCARFNKCIDLENLAVGDLFRRRVNGEETPELKNEISRQLRKALQKTPYLETEDAEKFCNDFSHQYPPSRLGEVFGRYSDIATQLHNTFGLDYGELQREMVSLNMDFCRKNKAD